MLSAKYILGSLLALALAFIVIAAIVTGIGHYFTKGITNLPNAQLHALRVGNYEKAYAYTSTEFQKITPFNEFKTFVSEFPILKTNVRLNFYKKVFAANSAELVGTLEDPNGKKTGIKYYLVYEDKQWKIFGFRLFALGENDEILSITDITPAKTIIHSTPNNVSLTNNFDNSDGAYTMKYPSDWNFEKTNKGTVVFSGPKDSPSFYTTVNIQNILTKKNGGQYETLDTFIQDFKEQAKQQSNFKILEEGDINHDGMKGKWIVLTYNYQGQQIKQLQYVFLRNDGQLFYGWAYTAPIERYDNYLPYAKAMLPTFKIRESTSGNAAKVDEEARQQAQ